MSDDVPDATEDATQNVDGRRAPRMLWLIAVVTIALCVVSVPTRHVGVALAALLVVAAVVLRRRGFRVTAVGVVGVLSLLIAAGSTYACSAFFPKESELDGRANEAHTEEQGAFDNAFEAASAPPGSTKEGEP